MCVFFFWGGGEVLGGGMPLVVQVPAAGHVAGGVHLVDGLRLAAGLPTVARHLLAKRAGPVPVVSVAFAEGVRPKEQEAQGCLQVEHRVFQYLIEQYLIEQYLVQYYIQHRLAPVALHAQQCPPCVACFCEASQSFASMFCSNSSDL